ncbi:DeoR/GlpR family DNA-binding transcription regulator [Paraclostridium sordellii]|uniref:DeoR/GlpR family DNA-binding transcription regulator n=1 Tax=Paraclostridium sordellii TaxID=1505 RepID=UPI0005E06552|nr:DeoR/GlpR family DNA-binding transcription regulator [Paeniclostridium sordellii]CEO30867.1 DeoR family transcriptional regulator [[Clostridium] sordellii] [Paeniclostridium sordellii]CEQ16293.1 DeoR family transcriptional regulator [[Clostridium] sordellii] [Paeniclostridium sordellii]CEQ19386.1 DeoR family transcriptional regulator [[Clostridium] sordellii] [Paeniclostridium sordellii]
MFLEERYEKIIELIEEKGRVKVKDLSNLFSVTEDCIRKDLKELESRGHLKRVYGGAIAQRNHIEIKKVEERKYINIEAKKSIALNAITLIENKDVIFLDTSTNNLELAKELNKTNKDITVVTNMIEIVLELKRNKNIKIILIGGEFNKEVEAIVGAAADRYIRKFTYDKAFIGLCGINKETGYISTVNLEDGNTKKTIIECSNRNYLVMENEKFNYDEFYKFATLDEITGIITEGGIVK